MDLTMPLLRASYVTFLFLLILPVPPVDSASGRVLLHNVSWQLYESLLEEVGDQSIQLTYDNGDLEIISPFPEHETFKKIIGGSIEILPWN